MRLNRPQSLNLNPNLNLNLSPSLVSKSSPQR